MGPDSRNCSVEPDSGNRALCTIIYGEGKLRITELWFVEFKLITKIAPAKGL
jgi:hypothetical protein